MNRWKDKKIEMNKKYELKTKEDLEDFVNFALTYSVDYTYILETIERFLNGKQDSWIPENYIDYQEELCLKFLKLYY